ncbi:hypothetical protein OHA02_52125 [Streptomyces phaeochromogenes]|nr:hypothetical protein [Streptomyces phaeochromogenes]
MSRPVPLPACTRRPHRPGGRPRRPFHHPSTARGRLAAAVDSVLRGWTDVEVADHATATVLPLSAATVGRARSGRCVPSAETVKALAAVAGIDPAELLRLRTEAVWQPYAPTDTPRVTRTVIVETLGESLDALRHRRRNPVPYRELARRVGLRERTVRDRFAGIWPAGPRRQEELVRQLDALLRALGVPDTATYLWHVPVRRGLSRSPRWGVTRRSRWSS